MFGYLRHFTDGYKIRYMPTFTPVATWSDYNETVVESFTFGEFVPGGVYRFEVLAKSGFEWSEPAEAEFELRKFYRIEYVSSPYVSIKTSQN